MTWPTHRCLPLLCIRRVPLRVGTIVAEIHIVCNLRSIVLSVTPLLLPRRKLSNRARGNTPFRLLIYDFSLTYLGPLVQTCGKFTVIMGLIDKLQASMFSYVMNGGSRIAE